MDAAQSFFRVTYVAPSGFKYELTGKASSEAEAVRLADETIEYVERIGIHPSEAIPRFCPVITNPDGTVKRK